MLVVSSPVAIFRMQILGLDLRLVCWTLEPLYTFIWSTFDHHCVYFIAIPGISHI